MEIIPVIYLYGGKCVSFYKGNKDHMTVYPKSPKNYAAIFTSHGAKTLQIVDKDGENFGIVKEIAKNLPDVKIQLASKIRTMDFLEKVFDSGIYRAVIGVSGNAILKDAIKKYGQDKIFAGIKGKDRIVMTSGNVKEGTEVCEYAKTLAEMGVENLVYHDLWSEGTLIHPNYDELERLVNLTNLNIYMSGGIGDIKHLTLLEKTGAKGALIGKALYEHNFSLDRLFI